MGTEIPVISSHSETNIYTLLSSRAHVYIIESANVFALIDTGTGGQRVRLLKHIASFLEKGCRFEYLILTHTHFDHAHSTAELQQKYGCKVLVQKNERNWLRQGYGHLPRSKYWLIDRFTQLGHRKVSQFFSYPPVEPDLVVEDELNLQLGNAKLRLFHTPGHSPGSMSIAVNNDFVITGDTLVHLHRGHIFPAFADDKKLVLEQWEKYLREPANVFLPTHGRPVSKQLIRDKLPFYRKKYGKLASR